MSTVRAASTEGRWTLYRLLAEPGRLRLLALLAEEELSIGELAELLEDSQPNVSRQTATLRQAGLAVDRREGTRTFVRFADAMRADAVVRDALAEGRRLCHDERRLERVASVLQKRAEWRNQQAAADEPVELEYAIATELPVFALALAGVTVERGVAVDAATGDGRMLDLLAPFFTKVIGIERSASALKRAEARVAKRGYPNVELHCGGIEDREVRRSVGAGANAVFASRLLHHSREPLETMAALAALLVSGGELTVIEYQLHDDQRLRERHGDLWTGFSREELLRLARAVGLAHPRCHGVPRGFVGNARDSHVPWQILRAERAFGAS